MKIFQKVQLETSCLVPRPIRPSPSLLLHDWLFKIKKTDTESCKCGSTMTGTHVVEECPELDEWRPRRAVWKEWREALGGRAVSKKEAEEEGIYWVLSFFEFTNFFFPFPTHLQLSTDLPFLTGIQSSLFLLLLLFLSSFLLLFPLCHPFLMRLLMFLLFRLIIPSSLLLISYLLLPRSLLPHF